MRSVKLACILFLCGMCLSGYSQKSNLQELVNKKKYAEVINFAGKLTKADSASYETMFLIGQAYEGMLKNRDAYRFYKYCLSKDTTNIDALNAVGRSASYLGYTDEAIGNYYKVLYADSTDFFANYQMARLYVQMGKYEAANAYFGVLLQQDPENSALWTSMGDCNAKINTPDGIYASISCYKKAFSYNPENAALGHLLVNSMLRLNEETIIKSALSICDTALVYNPENQDLRRDKAMALFMVKEYVAADSVFTSLITEGDVCYINQKYAGASRYKAGLFMQSIEPLEAAFDMDTTEVEVNLLLGSAYGKTFDRKKGLAFLDSAEVYMQPAKDMRFQLAFYRAEIYQKDGNPVQAGIKYYEAYTINPKRLDMLERISNLYWARKLEDYKADYAKRSLGAKMLFIKEYLKRDDAEYKKLSYLRPHLQLYYEDLFFRNESSYQAVLPDGKKLAVTSQELKALMDKIPEPVIRTM